MKFSKNQIYFLGIGGIGMSALAQYFAANGYIVAGYDRTKNNVCELLEVLNINIHYKDNVDLIPELFKNSEKTLIIITPALEKDDANNYELTFFKKNGFEIINRAKTLGLITNSENSIAIAGAHGKTSITSICANIFSKSKYDCNAFSGGICKNFMSNFHQGKSNFFIIEADEYNRSFHELLPTTALITYIDPDHLDIYENKQNLFDAFVIFANNIKQNGCLVISNYVPIHFIKKIRPDIKIFVYGIKNEKQKLDFFADNIKYENGNCFFDFNYNNGKIEKIKYKLGGNHNIENAIAAASCAFINKISEEEIRFGLESFEGVERRFDIKIADKNFIYIDDYAHHPNEIKAFLNSVRLLYPLKKITGIFQPHTFTRTRDFYMEFAESLSLCDVIILLPIYPAREKPIYGITSEMIFNKIEKKEKYICEKSELFKILNTIKTDILLTIGAGDIDREVKNILEWYTFGVKNI